jgi:hypothetical protein
MPSGNFIEPSNGISPATDLKNVDFPEPFSPFTQIIPDVSVNAFISRIR